MLLALNYSSTKRKSLIVISSSKTSSAAIGTSSSLISALQTVSSIVPTIMQTSCGFPCYAALELVISEGLNIGFALVIESCNLILYAMLALSIQMATTPIPSTSAS
jgi:hypothetical protein